MSLSEGISSLIAEQNSGKRFIKQLSLTTSAQVAAIGVGTQTADDLALTVPNGATICLQSDQDFNYELRTLSTATPHVTATTGAQPGVKVLAGQQEFVTIGSKDLALDFIGAASGKLNVFLVRSA